MRTPRLATDSEYRTMWEVNTNHRSSMARPWGWAISCSLAAHLMIILLMGAYTCSPASRLSQPGPIKIDLILAPPRKVVTEINLVPEKKSQPEKKLQEKRTKPVTTRIKTRIKPPPSPVQVATTTTLSVPANRVAPVAEKIIPTREDPPETTQTKINNSPVKTILPQPESSATQSAPFQGQVQSGTNSDFLDYAATLRAKIDKMKQYPLMARRAGRQGIVSVEFSIKQDGALLESKVTNSCGNRRLDKAALKALKRASPFEPLPENLESPQKFSVQITFTLSS